MTGPGPDRTLRYVCYCILVFLLPACAGFDKSVSKVGKGVVSFAEELNRSLETANDTASSEAPSSTPTLFRRSILVIIVHGTTHSKFLGVDFAGRDWVNPNTPGTFAAELRNAIREERPHDTVDVVPFYWDGDNSNASRHNAGIRLAQMLDSIPRSNDTYVVAHSHGGTVALRALTFSHNDADAVFLLGTPHLGVNVRIRETNRCYRFPLYLPLPHELGGAALINAYSPMDSVATFWADLFPGTTFTDLAYTNAEPWRKYYRLDRVAYQTVDPRTQRVQTEIAGTTAEYDCHRSLQNQPAMVDSKPATP